MNLAQATAALQARGFAYLDTGRCIIMLNAAKNALEDEWPWPWLEATATGTAPLTIADMKYVLSVVDTTNGQELQGVDFRDVVDSDQTGSSDTAGTPGQFWLDGETTLRVYPTAAISLSVRYVKYSSELTGTDTPLIPARYHHVWIDYAVVEAYKDDDNLPAASGLLADIRARRLQQMIENYAWRNRANPAYQVTTFSSEDW